MNTKTCEACAMSIDARASKCPHCQTLQADAAPMHRGYPGKVIAGVCMALSKQFGLDPTLVRAGMIVLVAMSAGTVFWLYAMLWVATPSVPHGRAPLARFIDWISTLFSSSNVPQNPTSV